KGVVVVNSAGNRDFWSKINFPSDGDRVIAVGAVNSGGSLTGFSSIGPTADGRIKPDVVAMGQGVYAVSTSRGEEESYTLINGTSASCPLVAGVCALVLQAHPEWGPMEVRDAIRNTASRAADPDTLYGWGLVDAYKAVFYKSMVFTNIKLASLVAEGLESVEVDIFSETGLVTDSVFLFYRIKGTAGFNGVKMTHQANANSQRFGALFPLPLDTEEIEFYIEAVDTIGIRHVGPLGAPGILYSTETPEAFLLYQNFPNPFNTETTILFDVMSKSDVTLTIFDLLGRDVITLVDESLNPGKKMIIWKGVDRLGFRVSSGIYFCQMEVGNKTQIRKMIIMK
ncbi:MAG: S8/S53 family peptidase, partial [Candidatus Hodarchaeota archaeon]